MARYSLTDIYQIYDWGGGNLLSSAKLYTLKMEAVGAYYTQTIRHQIPQNSDLHSLRPMSEILYKVKI